MAVSAAVLPAAADVTQVGSASELLSIAELQREMVERGRIIRSFWIEGVVCAVLRDRNLLVLQDGSASVLIEVPALDEGIRPGERVEITMNHCAVSRNRFGIQLGTAPVVNNDGHHGPLVKSGKVYLDAGMQPIRVTWFNGFGSSALQVDYEGPGIGRQIIPPGALWRKPPGASAPGNFQPGLDFFGYTGDWFFALPDFRRLVPVNQGVATSFDLKYGVRQQNVALAFNGCLKVLTAGIYTFYLNSDDGSYLYAGNPADSCKLTPLGNGIVPPPKSFEEALTGRDDHLWTELEGDVTFVAQNGQELDMEVSAKGERVRVEVVESSSSIFTNLLHQRVQVVGILETSPDPEQRARMRLIVPGSDQLEFHDLEADARSADSATPKVLTTAAEIRHLTHAEAERGLPARIRGVVSWNSEGALVLQDATGGVYIHYFTNDWLEQPCVGESWEIEGKTDPGDFSPVILAQKGTFGGNGVLPEPIRPTWDQLINGSLDAQYVELRGAFTEISPNAMTLLTSEGKIRIIGADDHPLPSLPALPPGCQSYLDSVVRIRGCFKATWDTRTHQVEGGEILISPGTVEIEEFAPLDPYCLATRRIADLMRFDPGASLLQRIKVKGQIVFTDRGEYCLQDGEAGLRLRTKQPLPLQPGDQVEAVGFPKLGGPSPILQEAQVRTTGRLPLPPPVPIAGGELLNHKHDSTLVQVEAVLVNSRTNRLERVLELQAGQSQFIARLKSIWPGAQPLERGSKLQLTGVYFGAVGQEAGGNLDAFELRLNNPADIRLIAQPPWWTLERLMAAVTVLTAGLMLAFLWITLLRRQVERRTVQLKREIGEREQAEKARAIEQERARIARDLHDDLGGNLTEISMLAMTASEVKLNPEQSGQCLQQIADKSFSMVTALDELVWAVNPKNDTIASVVEYLASFADEFFLRTQITCQMDIPSACPQRVIAAETRHHVLLSVKEVFNNAVRHGRPTEVSMRLSLLGDRFEIAIQDNGIGFDPERHPKGNGLANLQERMQELNGRCRIQSTPGKGTLVFLDLPL